MGLIRIDGSTMEGGGQVVRISIACAVVLRRAVNIYKIRAGRSKPGLKAQHLKGLELVTSLCGGQLAGGAMNSQEITLTPSQIMPGHYHADVGTAGSVCLLLQAALPCSLFAKGPTHFTLTGGTDAEMAPPSDYISNVFTPVAANFGVEFELKTVRRGFFPQGGGEVRAQIKPLTKPLQAVTFINRGKVISVEGVCFLSGLPPHLAHRTVDCAVNRLMTCPELQNININIRKDIGGDARGKGLGLILWCRTDTGMTLGASKLGQMHLSRQRSTTPEEVGTTAADKLLEEINANVCVDSEMQNQIIVLMGLAAGHSKVICGKLSLHSQTAITIMQEMTQAKFTVIEESPDRVMMECEGIGLNPDSLPCTM